MPLALLGVIFGLFVGFSAVTCWASFLKTSYFLAVFNALGCLALFLLHFCIGWALSWMLSLLCTVDTVAASFMGTLRKAYVPVMWVLTIYGVLLLSLAMVLIVIIQRVFMC